MRKALWTVLKILSFTLKLTRSHREFLKRVTAPDLHFAKLPGLHEWGGVERTQRKSTWKTVMLAQARRDGVPNEGTEVRMQ